MGHAIQWTTCANEDIHKCLKRCLATAYDPMETSSYHGDMTIHKQPICANEEEAREFIREHDTGWYSDHAVRFKDGRKYTWLIKYEWHC